MFARHGLIRVFLVASFGVVAMRAVAQEAKPAAGKDASKPRFVVAEVVELKAKVDAVDQAKRLVTLTNPDGETVIVKAGPAVKNLSQIKAGDDLVIKYFESIALFIHKPGETPSASESMAVAVGEKGKEPEAVAVDTFEYKATIEAVHPILHRLTLKGPDGKKRSFRIHESYKDIEKIKKGDELIIRHTEALAISIEKS